MKHLSLCLLCAGLMLGQAFPGAVATDQDLLVAIDLGQSALTGGITAAATTIPVANGTAFAQYSVILIENEQIKICTISTNTLNVCSGGRGFGGTTAASHTIGRNVRAINAAAYHNVLRAEIKAIETALGTNLSNVATAASIQAGTPLYCRSTAGSDTYACNVTPSLTAYTRGGCIVLDGDTANTGTATVNVNALGAKSILNRAGSALSNADITANKPITLCYDGTQYIIQGDGGAAAGVTSISGTTNEISASAATGAVTLSLAPYVDLGAHSFEAPNSTTLPGSCNPGEIYQDTDATSGQQLYACEGGTFVLQGDGTAAGGSGSAHIQNFNFPLTDASANAYPASGMLPVYSGSPGALTCTDTNGRQCYRVVNDAADTAFMIQTPLPSTWDSTTNLVLNVRYAGNTTANANIRIEPQTSCLGDNEVFNAAITWNAADSFNSPEGTAVGAYKSVTQNLTKTGCAAGEQLRVLVTFKRTDGTNDTSSAGIYFFGLGLKYFTTD